MNERHGHNSDVNRAVLSHLKAQAEGSAQWFEHGRTQAPLSTWGIHVFDDASMWMRQPTSIPKRRSLSAPSRMERNLSKHGRNIRLPVLTLTEHILQTPAFASMRPCRMLAPVSPCMPMAAANWQTIQNDWKKWTLTNGFKVGEKIDPDRVVKDTSGGEKIIWLAKDSVSANLCIEGGGSGISHSVAEDCGSVYNVRPSLHITSGSLGHEAIH